MFQKCLLDEEEGGGGAQGKEEAKRDKAGG